VKDAENKTRFSDYPRARGVAHGRARTKTLAFLGAHDFFLITGRFSCKNYFKNPQSVVF
jgi:hypothetical protein